MKHVLTAAAVLFAGTLTARWISLPSQGEMADGFDTHVTAVHHSFDYETSYSLNTLQYFISVPQKFDSPAEDESSSYPSSTTLHEKIRSVLAPFFKKDFQ